MSLINFSGLNWLAMLVSLIAGMLAWTIISMPFKKIFLSAGVTEEEFNKYNKSGRAWIIGFITQIIAVIILALLLNGFGITDIGTAVVFVVLVGISFVLCQTINIDQMYKRPLSYTILNVVLFLAAFITHAIVLVLWN